MNKQKILRFCLFVVSAAYSIIFFFITVMTAFNFAFLWQELDKSGTGTVVKIEKYRGGRELFLDNQKTFRLSFRKVSVRVGERFSKTKGSLIYLTNGKKVAIDDIFYTLLDPFCLEVAPCFSFVVFMVFLQVFLLIYYAFNRKTPMEYALTTFYKITCAEHARATHGLEVTPSDEIEVEFSEFGQKTLILFPLWMMIYYSIIYAIAGR